MTVEGTGRLMPDSVELRFPDAWSVVPTEHQSYAKWSRAIIESADRAAEVSLRRWVELMLDRLRRELRNGDVKIAAVYVDRESIMPVDSDEPIPIIGTCTVVLRTALELGSDGPITPELILAALSSTRSSEGGVQAIDVDPPDIVDIGGARAVRSTRFTTEGRGLNSQAVYTETYFVPFERSGHVAVAHFATPTVIMARLLSVVFAAIAATLRLHYPGEATVPGSEGT